MGSCTQPGHAFCQQCLLSFSLDRGGEKEALPEWRQAQPSGLVLISLVKLVFFQCEHPSVYKPTKTEPRCTKHKAMNMSSRLHPSNV